MECVVEPENMQFPHLCRRTEFGRSRSNTGCAGPYLLEMGRDWSTKRPLTWVAVPYLIALGQTVRTWVWVSARKWVPRVPTFKVTQGHRNWHGSIGYLWLPINVP